MYCSGKENPADLSSRGPNLEERTNNPIFLYGPSWLSEDTIQKDAAIYMCERGKYAPKEFCASTIECNSPPVLNSLELNFNTKATRKLMTFSILNKTNHMLGIPINL